MKKRILIFIFLSIITTPTFSQSGQFSLIVTPGLEIPFGPSTPDGSPMYRIGGSVNLTGNYYFPGTSLFFGTGILDYSFINTNADSLISFLSASIGAGIRLKPIPKMEFNLSASLGWGLALYEGSAGNYPMGIARATASYNFTPSFNLGIGATYKYLHGIYNGLGVVLGATFNLGSSSNRSKLEIPSINIDPIFPVFYSYYDQNPFGSITIQNRENGDIENVRISLMVPQYMDSPKLCAVVPEIEKNGEVRIPVLALFSDHILSITEGTKAAAEVSIEYEYLETDMVKKVTTAVQMYDRNSMTWDDDRKAASFVTSKDPVILNFSKNIAGNIRERGSSAINLNFRIAMGIFQALSLYGINYVVDPKTPYEEYSKNKYTLDYLQFPSQTLTYKAGDCDDLSILYSALLKSVGIDVAFITVPGHIYMAFALEMSSSEARRTFSSYDNLIEHNDKIWIPVEITIIDQGFLKAWERGASQWKSAGGERGFFPIDEAWSLYKPVRSPVAEQGKINPPDFDDLYPSFNRELNTFIRREIEPQISRLQEKIEKNENPNRDINRLGVLYARYGLFDEAVTELLKIAGTSVSAMTNLGNIHFQTKNIMGALEWYDKALALDSDNKTALLGAARANYEMENFGSVKILYAKVEELDSELASRFSYLISRSNDTDRATSLSLRDGAVWDDPD